MLAGGADEPDLAGEAPDTSAEAASFVLLGRAPAASGRTAEVRVAGWGTAGPGLLDVAIGQALDMSDSDEHPPIATFDPRQWGGGSAASALACAQAVQTLAGGRASRALVTSDGGGCASLALLLSSRRG